MAFDSLGQYSGAATNVVITLYIVGVVIVLGVFAFLAWSILRFNTPVHIRRYSKDKGNMYELDRARRVQKGTLVYYALRKNKLWIKPPNTASETHYTKSFMGYVQILRLVEVTSGLLVHEQTPDEMAGNYSVKDRSHIELWNELQRKENYEKYHTPSFMERYGAAVVSGLFLMVVLVGFIVLLDKFEVITQVADALNSASANLASMNQPSTFPGGTP